MREKSRGKRKETRRNSTVGLVPKNNERIDGKEEKNFCLITALHSQPQLLVVGYLFFPLNIQPNHSINTKYTKRRQKQELKIIFFVLVS